ncbi:WxL domain-containing protein [Enterococcus casseliflavus]|nr:WxL domain-containing protein [Enterococcus casseliflavus]
MSSLKSSEQLFMNIDDISITNNATVNIVGLAVTDYFGGTPIEKAERSKFTIEKGATLTTRESGLIAQNLIIEGNLDMKASSYYYGISITTSSVINSLAPLNITIGEDAKVRVEQDGVSFPVIRHRSNGHVNLTIAKGAEYDLINTRIGEPVLSSTSSNIQINTENLAVWNRGMTNVISSSPSRNFKDLEAQLTGVNGSTISSTNHTEFRSAYSTEGLFGYSRISNSGVAEQNLLQLELEASPADGGTPSAADTSLTEGSTTTINANPNSGYDFVRWEIVSGAGNIANPTFANTTFTMGASNAVVRAVYTPRAFTNIVISDPFIGGLVRVGTGQSSTMRTFDAFTNGQVEITAEPNPGYQFVGWTLGTPGTASFEDASKTTTRVTVFSQSTIRANFEPIPETYTLQLEASPADGGTPSAADTSLTEGSTTTISANPNSGYDFLRWEVVSGAGNIANPTFANTTFTMGASNTVLRAVYTPRAFVNTILSNPSIGGRVRVGTGLSNSTLTFSTFANDQVEISAEPNPGYQFVGWTLSTPGTAGFEDSSKTTTTVTVFSQSTIRANFEPIPETYTLQLEASPADGGTPSAANTSLTEGSITTINANPNSGYDFVRWEVVSGAGNIANATFANTTFTMGTSDTVVRAVYTPRAFISTIMSNPSIGGRVRVFNATSSTLTFSTFENEQVEISAVPNSGYRFVGWTLSTPETADFENASKTTTTITLFSQSTIVANFEPIPEYQLRLEASPAEGGRPSATNTSLTEGSTTTITANPNSGYDFVRWEIISGNGSIEDPISENTSFTMGSSDTIIQAVFEAEIPSVVDPLDPLDPEVEVNPENRPELPEDQGLLSIDFVSQFDFGKQPISAKEKTYYAKPQRLLDESGNVLENEERPNYVQVSDRRSSTERIGWRLSVTQDKQFADMNGNELTGAQVQFENQQLVSPQDGNSPTLKQSDEVPLIPGEKQVLLNAQEESGTGTWIYRFGDSDSANESVSLTVPSGAVSQASAYKTTFVWELNSVPENSDY